MSTDDKSNERITSAHVYKDGSGDLRVAIRYADDMEEDRPATLLEAALFAPSSIGETMVPVVEGRSFTLHNGERVVMNELGIFPASVTNPDTGRGIATGANEHPSATAPRINGITLIKLIRDQRDECADVLRELVTLKAMKDGFGVEPFGFHNNAEALSDYKRRKPLAWQAARAAVEKVPTYEQRLRNIAEGIGMTYEELLKAMTSAPTDGGSEFITCSYCGVVKEHHYDCPRAPVDSRRKV